MQTLYGIKITDRVTVEMYPAFGGYGAKFDGVPIGNLESNGAAAVRGAIAWLQERAHQREKDRKLEAELEVQNQNNEDDLFLEALATKLGIHTEDLEGLIDIIKRRNP